ncbi:ferritin family protein [Thermococcus sp. MAR1]|uniref:ferritin-like domain-containing protein n=1 Tax=Thermococcus sp. MAR1 TaxID=1638263 RepID=UPI00143ADBBA|nr:ferritin family protein [Thermococcus sp. MAR1]NJE10902.1 rubrerythrin [Thermococcus sp. MAR1]
MFEVEEIIERLQNLTYEKALAYWIKSEEEEAKFYGELAERARNLGLPQSLTETFLKLSRDSKRHAEELTKEFRKSFGKEPSTGIPPLEVVPVLDKFERADQVREVLEAAMESELIAMNAYKMLAGKVSEERLRELYLKLADVEKSHYEALKREYERLGG